MFASLVHDCGFLDCADIGSLSLLALSDEVIAMVNRFMRGVQADRDTWTATLMPSGSKRGWAAWKPGWTRPY